MGARYVPTVLIVEDEQLVCEITSEEFRDAGFTVVTAYDGDEALELLQSDQVIDLLFTDIRLPGSLDGWSIADAARRIRPSIPVIYATGFSAEQMRMVEGAIFFKKPYKPAAVVAAAADLGLL